MKQTFFSENWKMDSFLFFFSLHVLFVYRSDDRNSPIVCDSEPSHRNVVTLGAEIQHRQQVSGEGGG